MIRNPHTGFRSLGILEAGPMLEQGVYIDTANLKPPLNMDAADVELNIPSLAGIAKFRNVARLTIASWADGGNTDQQTLQQRGDRHDYFTSSPRNENIAPLYCVTSFVGEQGMSAGIWVNTSEITNRVFNGRRHVEYPGIRHTNGQIGMLAWYNIAIKMVCMSL